jgi:hypothetical protein
MFQRDAKVLPALENCEAGHVVGVLAFAVLIGERKLLPDLSADCPTSQRYSPRG